MRVLLGIHIQLVNYIGFGWQPASVVSCTQTGWLRDLGRI
jgi:hypothetical protein